MSLLAARHFTKSCNEANTLVIATIRTARTSFPTRSKRKSMGSTGNLTV